MSLIKGTKGKDIHYFFEAFLFTVKLQTEVFGSYYEFLHKISSELKIIGLDGKIHGSIVDIDFYHHIMVNPNDGTITFYYSPIWGIAKQYESFEKMLEDSIKNTIGEKKYLLVIQKYEELNGEKKLAISFNTIGGKYDPSFQVVPRDEGMYAISNRMNRIQSFFDIGVLGVWNEDLILKSKQILKNGDISEKTKNLL